MKIIHKDQAEIWETETAKGYEYPFNTKNIDCALVEINGRYPLKGWCRNTKVDEMIFCKSGHGFLVLQNGIYELNENDAILISKNEWYYWDEKTKAVFIPMCNPAWSKEQVETKATEKKL